MKRLFTLLFATILAIQGFAQAYEFDLEQSEYNSDHWLAELHEGIIVIEGKFLGMSLYTSQNYSVVLSFYLLDTNNNPHYLSYLIKDGEQGALQLYLDNGEVLTTSEAGKDHFFIALGAQRLKGQKNTSLGNNGGDAMKLLRNHNITKIRVQGHDFTTPGFRSAATIDAMCKALIGKTGDQGQYGSASTGGSSPQRQQQGGVVNSRDLTLRQMILHPFGVLPDNKNLTYDEAKRILANYPQWNCKYDTNSHDSTIKYIELQNNIGMFYNGNEISSYGATFYDNIIDNYEIYFHLDDHVDEAKKFYNSLISKLQGDGASLHDVSSFELPKMAKEGTYMGRKIRVSYVYVNFDGLGVTCGVLIEILGSV